MTPAEIAKEAEFVAEHCFDHSREVVRIARAYLVALAVVDEARAHVDLAEAVAAFDKTIEGMTL